ncbi:FG-GAP repeat domain-containing protein [Mucilaginibacter calamicampi]|uniref:FG-GAP repeat domain-containing protein n=1 Tax=Mucilaginibacter calamicampi TaxID=1302352 RepID=A0ABW2YW31_9SPHI
MIIKKSNVLLIVCAFICVAIVGIISCNSGTQSTGDRKAAIAEYMANGKALSKQYCQSCHMYPEPGLLNQDKWLVVLPEMGLRLGIKQHKEQDYTNTIDPSDFTPPSAAAMSAVEWQNILNYYLSKAPINLPEQKRNIAIDRQLPFFKVQKPASIFNGKQVLSSFVKIDNTVNPARVFVANAQAHKLYLLTPQLKIVDSVETEGPVVDMLFNNNQIFVTTIGKTLGANADKIGTVTELSINNGKIISGKVPLFNNLARPVQLLTADLNNDNKQDYLICEFGNMNGELVWMENKGPGNFIKHVISSRPGATKAYFDYRKNPLAPDIWVLFAQAREGIYHFINNGKGSFTEKQVLGFPPIYGSSSFDMVDMDNDGDKDIIYTCGDNGNASLSLKPYHGLYIYLNDGRDNFKQRYFYPVNGCYKAIAKDFDGDNKIDIATVSLFTDAAQPAEGFVYFKNTGNLTFKPYALPPKVRFERAVTMDAGDIDADGKTDLIIGNNYFENGPFGYYNVTEPLFFTLKNTAKNK